MTDLPEPKVTLDDDNSHWVDCYNCEDGYLYDCFDGFCINADEGCEDCQYPCNICGGKGGWRVPFESTAE